MNGVHLMGRMTRDVELKYTTSDKAVASFTVAAQRDRERADFIPCVAWEKTAQFIEQYFRKGDMIAVEGRLQTRTWDDSAGKKRTALEVVVSRAHFTGGAKTQNPPNKFTEIDDDGELPF